MTATVTLLAGTLGLLLAVNALRPVRAPALFAAASFLAGWLTSELAFHCMALQCVVLSVGVWKGALDTLPGQVGVGAGALSVLLLGRSALEGVRARRVVEALVTGPLGASAPRALPEDHAPAPMGWWLRRLLFPLPVTHPSVERTRAVVYAREGRLQLKLDVFRRRGAAHDEGARRPAVVFVHGGAWVLGSRDHHGLPMLQDLAARGCVCFSLDYRLSPRATFPEHLVDVKRALAWVRAHARAWGADPGFVVLSGGSAGGHLAALAALTADDKSYQPGFEDADTSVAACVGFYGVYDLADTRGHWPNPGLRRVLERWVFKARLADARERFARASPLARVHRDAPPFLLVHGALDTLVPVEEARVFHRALLDAGAESHYLELPGAQHAFEIFPSPRTLETVRCVAEFVRRVRGRAPQVG
ncbi:MAG: alpha/beta hydrolase [Deltaproteobacteria bacterium]|nr:alpha/beta hydrolase [Deltaproteobacteria bacterium]